VRQSVIPYLGRLLVGMDDIVGDITTSRHRVYWLMSVPLPPSVATRVSAIRWLKTAH